MKINRLITITCTITLATFICACQHIRIKGDGTPDKHGQPETIHGSYYGFNWSDFDEIKTKDKIALYKVRCNDNFAYALVGVLSLGLYKPMDIEYWTAVPLNEKVDNSEEWRPEKK